MKTQACSSTESVTLSLYTFLLYGLHCEPYCGSVAIDYIVDSLLWSVSQICQHSLYPIAPCQQLYPVGQSQPWAVCWIISLDTPSGHVLSTCLIFQPWAGKSNCHVHSATWRAFLSQAQQACMLQLALRPLISSLGWVGRWRLKVKYSFSFYCSAEMNRSFSILTLDPMDSLICLAVD